MSSTIRTLSLGAGVQSTALYLLACEDTDLHFDAAIFADTGWERAAVYQHLAKLEAAGSIPIHRVSSGNIRDDALDPAHRFVSMPLFVLGPEVEEEVIDEERPCQAAGCEWFRYHFDHDGVFLAEPDATDFENADDFKVELAKWRIRLADHTPPATHCMVCNDKGRIVLRSHIEKRRSKGMARRQCTSEYKLKPIKQQVRRMLGYPHPVPVPKGVHAEVAIGISTDEIIRARDSDVKYMRNVFPLLDLGWSRKDCERYLRTVGWVGVGKSACIGCPFHGNRQWRQLRDESPAEFADAVDFDASIRNGSARVGAAGKDLHESMFLHRSRVPLDQAPIDRVTGPEWADRQGDVFDAVEDGDPDGCSPWTCRSGERVTT